MADLCALKKEFEKIYGEGGEIRFFASPGRVNLIGEHTDYNGGFVFPAAISAESTVAVRKRDDRIVRIKATDIPDMVTLDLDKIGERTIQIDCDVIQADGGTRTASITGAFVATVIAIAKLMDEGLITENPVKSQIAAVSLGKVGGEIMTDLCYEEDCRADVDMNLILDGDENIVEIQGAAEHGTYKKAELDELKKSLV